MTKILKRGEVSYDLTKDIIYNICTLSILWKIQPHTWTNQHVRRGRFNKEVRSQRFAGESNISYQFIQFRRFIHWKHNPNSWGGGIKRYFCDRVFMLLISIIITSINLVSVVIGQVVVSFPAFSILPYFDFFPITI